MERKPERPPDWAAEYLERFLFGTVIVLVGLILLGIVTGLITLPA